MNTTDRRLANAPPSGVKIAPFDIVRRRFAAWQRIQGDSFEIINPFVSS